MQFRFYRCTHTCRCFSDKTCPLKMRVGFLLLVISVFKSGGIMASVRQRLLYGFSTDDREWPRPKCFIVIYKKQGLVGRIEVLNRRFVVDRQ